VSLMLSLHKVKTTRKMTEVPYLHTEAHVWVLDSLVTLMALVLQVSLVFGPKVVGVGGSSNDGGDADIDGDLAPGLGSGY